MLVEEERKHLKSKSSTNNITGSGGWLKVCLQIRLSTSAPGGIRTSVTFKAQNSKETGTRRENWGKCRKNRGKKMKGKAKLGWMNHIPDT